MPPEREEIADVLAKRHGCLRALTDEPMAKRDLVAALDLPRTTLDRAVRELTDADLAERVDGGYRATAFGREALSAHDHYLRRLDGLAAGARLLDALPADTPLGGAFLDGATVTVSEPASPDRVLEDLFESVEGGSTFVGVAPVALAGHLDAFHAALDGDDDETPEMLVAPDVLDNLVAIEEETLRDRVASDRHHLRVGPVPFRFGLWLVDDREAGVVAYTETGVQGVAVNDTPEAVAWAREQYEAVCADSEPVTLDLVDERVEAAGDTAER